MSDSLRPMDYMKPSRLLCPWGFSRQEYWSGSSCPPSGDLPNPGIKPWSPTLQADSLPSELPRKPKNTGMGSLFLLHGIFPTQESNQGLLHCRWILYHLSQQGSPRILEWVAYPFSNGTSQSRNELGVSCITGGFFYQLSYLRSHLSEWFSSIPQIINVGKNVERRELLCT